MTMPMVMVGGPRRDPNAPRPSLKERMAAMRLVPRLIRLVWDTQPAYATMMIALRFVRRGFGREPVVAKLIIDEVVLLARSGGSSRHLWELVALELGLPGGELLACVGARGPVGEITNRMSIRITEHAATSTCTQSRSRVLISSSARGSTTGRVMPSQPLGIGKHSTLIS